MNEPESRLRERLRAVYSETTIEHILRPHNTESIAAPDGYAALKTGDSEMIKIWLRIQNDTVEETAFWTNGCAATIACGSMCTDLARAKSVAQALAVTAQDIADALIDLPPGNYHCAELAVNALRAALLDFRAVQREPWKKLYRK
jgi:nitrogen fixation protein NifU and related proteins